MAASLEEQLAAVKQEMASRPANLVRHVERVAAEAVDLGRYYDIDPLRLELAAWGHDLFRAEPPERQLELAREIGVRVSKADEASPIVLHGPIAAAVLRDRFAIKDRDVLAAVRDHTLGLREMPMIAKVILLADKVEERKRERDPEMGPIRKLARRNLDIALLCWADWKWVQERQHGWQSHPTHWKARSTWLREHHFDIDPKDERLDLIPRRRR